MGEEPRFDNCPPYGDDYAGCTCGLLQLLGFHNRIGRTIKTGSYIRLRSTDHEKISSNKCKDHLISDGSVTKKDQVVLFQKKEKDRVLRASSYKRNIKAWIKKRISRKSNNKQKMYACSPRVSRTSSIHKSTSNSKFVQPKENIKELGRTLLDGILHKIPYGQKVPEELINGNKLFRSLSADYDSYTNKEKRGDLIDKNQEGNKYKRNNSSPAIVYERKIGGAIGEKCELEENLANNFDGLKQGKDEILLDLVKENENNEDKEGMVLIEDKNLVSEILDSKDEGFEVNLLVETDLESEINLLVETDLESEINLLGEMDLESEIEEKAETDLESEIEEKAETDLESEIEEKAETDLESEIEEKDETDLESEIEEKTKTDFESEIEEKTEMDLKTEMNLNSEQKDPFKNPKKIESLPNLLKQDPFKNPEKIESLPNLLKQLGLDLDTTNQAQIEEKDQNIPILDSNITLKDFSRIWDLINKSEFSKFDCNRMSLDLILVLDLIDQVYKQVYTNPSSNMHWVLNYKFKLDPKSVEKFVLKEVQERVKWHLSAEKECSDEADDIIGNWDFLRHDEWFDFRGDVESLVNELERLLLDDLIDDLMI